MAASIEQRTGKEKSLIEVMNYNKQYQNNALLGIFWYDDNKKELFGVKSSLSDGVKWYHSSTWNTNVRTEPRLHEQIWQKEYFRQKDKRFRGDYTRIPRGRIFEFENEGFKVLTGSWIDDYPNVRELILDEFELPQDTEFMQDSHWDIGHGWSQEYI